MHPTRFLLRASSSCSGSALLLVLMFIAFFSIIFLVLVETVLFENKRIARAAASYQASLAAESGLHAAIAELKLVTANNPSFLVGVTNSIETPQAAPVLMIGERSMTNSEQLIPLISGDFSHLVSYPVLDAGVVDAFLQERRAYDPKDVVDLNRPLVSITDENKVSEGFLKQSDEVPHPITAHGTYPAPWVIINNQAGQPIARYAFVVLDEQARLNPFLHQGKPRIDPDDWDHGVAVLSCSQLLTPQEEEQARAISSRERSLWFINKIFENKKDYDLNKEFLSPCSAAIPDLIPSSLPEGGLPKYDLNDLATNAIYGLTPTERALHIAEIIDHHLPHFKERDPSLKNLPASEQRRYLNRLAACIVNYIGPEQEPILVNQGEPSGAALTPLVTQTAERCRLLEQTSNSVTIENQYFIQLWNPYTTLIPSGSKATFTVSNRQELYFGTAPQAPFKDYVGTNNALPPLRPNESVVIAFPSVKQTWNSPTSLPHGQYPRWLKGPEGNADPRHHQSFIFSWNDHLVMMSRQPPIGPGPTEGGLEHDAQSLSDMLYFWQCNFIPTEVDHSGHFRFVGDPRENYLSNYLWKSYSSEKSYVTETRWKGLMSQASPERLFDPEASWKNRDFVPVNPIPGNNPSSRSMTPDQIISDYKESRDGIMAPLVMRHGPMKSIVELGNINDPAQADDLGNAPVAGASDNKSSIYASGGGRTLRIGQPEFFYWDTPGKRAIELIDLFTVANTNNIGVTIEKKTRNQTNGSSTMIFREGLINVNTASHEVLTALFYGITPTSDQRFTHSMISREKAEELATFLQEHRPYEKLSDLQVITPLLANASTYTPPLSTNVTSPNMPPLAALFDRAREEGFGKMISLCTVTSRAFRVYCLGESLNKNGKTTAQALLEASIVLIPKEEKNGVNAMDREIKLVPSAEKKEWLK